MWKILKKYMRVIKTCNVYLDFFMLGMATSLTGPCLLDLQSAVQTDTQHIALIYTARSSGFLVGAILGALILRLVKSKQIVLMLCNFVITVTIFGIPWSRNIETLIGFMVVFGLAIGAIETGANVVCLQLWGKKSAPFFQGMHFGFGLGSLVSPLVAAPFLIHHRQKEDFRSVAADNLTLLSSSGDDDPLLPNPVVNATDHGVVSGVTYPFSIIGACALLVTAMFAFTSVASPTEDAEVDEDDPEVRSSEAEGDSGRRKRRSSGFMFVTFSLTFLIFVVGIGTEIGFGQALTTYAVKGGLHTSVVKGSYMTSAFWAAFTVSRLVAIVLMAFSIDNLALTVGNLCLVALSSLVLLFLTGSELGLWLGAVLFGAGTGPLYASLVGWLAAHVPVGSVISALVTAGVAVGEMLGPFLITYFMEDVPEMLAFVVAASTVVMSSLIFVQYCVFRSGNRRVEQQQQEQVKTVECYVIDKAEECRS